MSLELCINTVPGTRLTPSRLINLKIPGKGFGAQGLIREVTVTTGGQCGAPFLPHTIGARLHAGSITGRVHLDTVSAGADSRNPNCTIRTPPLLLLEMGLYIHFRHRAPRTRSSPPEIHSSPARIRTTGVVHAGHYVSLGRLGGRVKSEKPHTNH